MFHKAPTRSAGRCQDKYLREKVKHIIARQKGGAIAIAAYKDGSVLPSFSHSSGTNFLPPLHSSTK